MMMMGGRLGWPWPWVDGCGVVMFVKDDDCLVCRGRSVVGVGVGLLWVQRRVNAWGLDDE